MAKPVDARDLKSLGRKAVRVRPPPSAPAGALQIRLPKPTGRMTIEPTPHLLTTPRSLIEAGLAAPERLAEFEAVAERYAIAVPPALGRADRPGDPADPIARQFVPDSRELIRDPAELDDPIGDDADEPDSRAGASLSRSGAVEAGLGLRGLLPLLLSARNGRSRRGRARRGRVRRGARLYRARIRKSGRSC